MSLFVAGLNHRTAPVELREQLAVEESKLRDPGYQDQLVDALASGLAKYFAKNPPMARKRSTTM